MEEYQTIKKLHEKQKEILDVLQDILDLLGSNKLKLIFDVGSNDASKIESIIVYKGQTYGILPVPSRPGYVFQGWYINRYEISNGEYKYANEIENLSLVEQNGSLIVYAKWEPAWIPVNLNPCGGSVQPETISVQYLGKFGDANQGPDMEKGLPTPVMPDRNFSYWYYIADSYEVALDDDSQMVYVNPPELSAKWNNAIFVLSFDIGNADGHINPLNIPSDTIYNLSAYTWDRISSSIENPGYYFMGWSVTPRARDIIIHNPHPESEPLSIEVKRNMTLYAIWDNEPYTIDFYDLIGRKVASQITKLNVPDYLRSIETMNGKFTGFDHWNSTPGTYADYMKLGDSDLIYNLTEIEGQTVPLYASTSKITNELLSIILDFNEFPQLSVGHKITIPTGKHVYAVFSDRRNISVDVTNAVRIYPTYAKIGLSNVYVSFKYDGDETEYGIKNVEVIPVPEKLQIISPPRRVDYTIDERMNLIGFKVAVISSDNIASAEIPREELWEHCRPTHEEYLSNYNDPEFLDNPYVEVDYAGLIARQPIKIEPISIPKSIQILKYPNKMEYDVGDSLDTTGIIVMGYFSYGNDEKIVSRNITDECTFTPSTNLQMSTRKITVTYKGTSTTFDIYVSGQEVVASLSVAVPPNKLTYNMGETFNLSGTILSIQYNTGNIVSVEASLDNCEVSPMYNLLPENTEVSVKYLVDNPYGEIAIQPITVKLVGSRKVLFKVDSDSITMKNGNEDLSKFLAYHDATNPNIIRVKFYDENESKFDLYNIDTSNYLSLIFTEDLSNLANMRLEEFLDSNSKSNLLECKINELTSITMLGNDIFRNCDSLTNYAGFGQLREVGDRAFDGCSKLSSTVLHANLSSIGNYAFRDCSNFHTKNYNLTLNAYKYSFGRQCFENTNFVLTFHGIALSNVPNLMNYPWGLLPSHIHV